MPNAKRLEHWFYISAVDVSAPKDSAAIAILGDSITDGHTASMNGNERWPDQLARRLHDCRLTRKRGVLNQGIGGNRLLLDGLGPNALSRFDRNVLDVSGVRYLIVLEGINDLGTLTLNGEVPRASHYALVSNILAAYSQIIARAHDHDIMVIGGTLTPDEGNPYYRDSSLSEADRRVINEWIRAPGHFDGVIDFDRALRDPLHPTRLRPEDDSGDHIHPSPAGYRAMADAVPIELLAGK